MCCSPSRGQRRASSAARRDRASVPLPTLAPLLKCAPSAKTQMTVMKAIAAALLLATGIALVAAAQTAADFPSRPVKLLVPFAAGGPTDVVARILADLLSARWGGQSVVIENRPGAGTIVATAALAKAPADGYTMLVATNSLLINPAIGQ